MTTGKLATTLEDGLVVYTATYPEAQTHELVASKTIVVGSGQTRHVYRDSVGITRAPESD